MNVGEPIQQEPLFASRPRWALEVGDKKVTGAVAKHMTAAVNMVHATDYMTSRGDHASPIRIGSAQRNYGTDTEWNAMRYSTNKWNASMRPKIFITKMLSDWLPIHDTRPGRGNRGRDFSDVVLKEGLQLGVCDHCSDRWSLGHLWSDCQHKEVVGIRQQGRAEREAAVVDAGWLGMEAQSVLRWWFRSELLLNGTYPPAGTAPTPYVGDATACVVADFSAALMVHGNGARLKGLLTKHLRRSLVQHAVDVPGKHLKVLFLMRDITVSYWEEAYALWQWWCKHVHADRDPGAFRSTYSGRIAMYAVEVRREMRAAGLESELDEAQMMGSESMHRTMRHWMGVRRWKAQITRFFHAVGGAVPRLPAGRRGEYEGLCAQFRRAQSNGNLPTEAPGRAGVSQSADRAGSSGDRRNGVTGDGASHSSAGRQRHKEGGGGGGSAVQRPVKKRHEGSCAPCDEQQRKMRRILRYICPTAFAHPSYHRAAAGMARRALLKRGRLARSRVNELKRGPMKRLRSATAQLPAAATAAVMAMMAAASAWLVASRAAVGAEAA